VVTGPDIPPRTHIDAIAEVLQGTLDAAITPRPIRLRHPLHLSLQDRTLVDRALMTVSLSFMPRAYRHLRHSSTCEQPVG
jgi:hypothetical protein